jgi:hypothetical protein
MNGRISRTWLAAIEEQTQEVGSFPAVCRVSSNSENVRIPKTLLFFVHDRTFRLPRLPVVPFAMAKLRATCRGTGALASLFGPLDLTVRLDPVTLARHRCHACPPRLSAPGHRFKDARRLCLLLCDNLSFGIPLRHSPA